MRYDRTKTFSPFQPRRVATDRIRGGGGGGGDGSAPQGARKRRLLLRNSPTLNTRKRTHTHTHIRTTHDIMVRTSLLARAFLGYVIVRP